MAAIDLKPTQMHWMENSDPFRDCCVHGGIRLKIDDYVASDGLFGEWTVSTSAFNLLRTLFHDQPVTGRESLIPHCGFTMWPVDSELDGLYMPNCDIGINWSIRHEEDNVIHNFKDGTELATPIAGWRWAVCRFADEIDEFMRTAWPKVIDDPLDKRGFELFLSLWQKRRAEAELGHGSSASN